LRRVLAALLAAVALAAAAPGAATAATTGLPKGWPRTFALGLADQPGGAAAIHRHGLRFRYQYLTGGVDTGGGWSTWNPDGTFVSRYVRESRRAGVIPVFTYYQLLQSNPGHGPSGEVEHDLANLQDPSLMARYVDDLRLALRRMAGKGLVVLHVEPDLWGFVEQSPDPAVLAAARDLAQRVVALRDELAPNVALAWHLSTWGTGEDPTYSKPGRAHLDALAARSARFYASLHVHFDLVFNDVADRDAGFRDKVLGDGGRSAWKAGDFHRHATYVRGFTRRTHAPVVLWQVPLGNSHLPDTWGRFRDSRVQWWLGAHRRKHLREARRAGIVALLFGGGADGTTSAKTDGGLFYRLARAYARHPLALAG
jgi:hypothetical protein